MRVASVEKVVVPSDSEKVSCMDGAGGSGADGGAELLLLLLPPKLGKEVGKRPPAVGGAVTSMAAA